MASEQTALSKGGKSMLSFEYSFLFCILEVSIDHCYFGLLITIYSPINDQYSILLELSHHVNSFLEVDDFKINSLCNSTINAEYVNLLPDFSLCNICD